MLRSSHRFDPLPSGVHVHPAYSAEGVVKPMVREVDIEKRSCAIREQPRSVQRQWGVIRESQPLDNYKIGVSVDPEALGDRAVPRQ